MEISNFTGINNWLDNNYGEPFIFKCITYMNAEAAFQAQKTADKEIQEVFSYLPGKLAKKVGRKLTLPSDWDDKKVDIMYDVLYAKFSQNQYLKERLIETEDVTIKYINNEGDVFWGICNGEGQNMLGNILMSVRKVLQHGVIDDSLRENFLYNRLVEAQAEHNRLIIAYDIDDTIRPYKSLSCENVKSLIKRAKKILNPYFIVFTANPHKGKNIDFLESQGLPYDAINENADFIGRYGDGLKVYYNLLLDDKAGLKEAYDALDRLCDDYEEMLF